MRLLKLKKSQEELVGFALIVVIVAVIAIVFLGISMRKPHDTRTSVEASDFLHSSFLYSVECSQQVSNINDLILACSRNENCENSDSCELLKSTYENMILSSLRLGDELKYKSYELRISSGNSSLVYLGSSNSSLNSVGSSAKVISYQESIDVNLKLYY